jgi:hypothetical protein
MSPGPAALPFSILMYQYLTRPIVLLYIHIAKTTYRILSRRTERKNKGVIGDQSGFRRGKETWDATGMLRI